MTPDPGRVRLGQHVRHQREQLGLSIRRAAKLASVTPPTWTAVEAATRTAHGHNVARMEQVLEWGPDSFDAILAGREPTPLPESAPFEPLTPRGRLLLQLYDELIAEGNTHEQADAAVEAEIVRIRRYLRDRQQKSSARVNPARPTG